MSIETWVVIAVFVSGMAVMWWAMSSRIDLIKSERDEALAARDEARANQKKIEEAADEQIEGVEEIVAASELPPRDELRMLLDTGLGAGAASKQPPGPAGGGSVYVADPRGEGLGKA